MPQTNLALFLCELPNRLLYVNIVLCVICKLDYNLWSYYHVL